MAIYGHTDSSTQPIRLREVAFQLSPEELRQVAAFLTSRATEIEAGTFVNGGRHLRDEHSGLSGYDVVVVPPSAAMAIYGHTDSQHQPIRLEGRVRFSPENCLTGRGVSDITAH